MGVAGSMQGIY